MEDDLPFLVNGRQPEFLMKSFKATESSETILRDSNKFNGRLSELAD